MTFAAVCATFWPPAVTRPLSNDRSNVSQPPHPPQVFDFKKTPAGLETPAYAVLRRCAAYEVRRYEPFLVAETPMDEVRAGRSSVTGGPPAGVSPAGPGGAAFGALAGYIFGGNEAGQRMAMTTPVFSDSAGRMRFVVGGGATDPGALPRPQGGSEVVTKQVPGGIFAAAAFDGIADPQQAQREEAALRCAPRRGGGALGVSLQRGCLSH